MIFGNAFGTVASMQAAVMKRPRFKFEDEWRLLIHYSAKLKAIGPQLKFNVFASGSILKSYFECPIDPKKDLKRVIVGHREAQPE